MPPLAIHRFPDPILRRAADPILKIDSRTIGFIKQLIETMRHQPGGIGIAATQVGVSKRIAIVDVSKKVPGAKLLVLINPVIVNSSYHVTLREGCMSLPDFTANVTRASTIRIRWHDLQMEKHEKMASGLEAQCIQHEVDHLNGILFVDRVRSIMSDVFRRMTYR